MTAPAMLERLREHLGVKNDAELAEAAGMAPSMVSRALRGKRETFDLPTLHRAAVLTGVPIGQLAEWWAEGQQRPDEI